MTQIHTARLTIRETDSSAITSIGHKNMEKDNSDLLSNLTAEDMKTLFEDKESLSMLIAKLSAYACQDDRLIYGAWLGAKLIGYVSLKDHSSPMPEIQIEFDPEYQNMGYGFELLSAMINHFIATGYTCLRYVAIASNTASIALAEKVGGILQNPDCNAERMLLRIYHISAPV